MRKFFVWGPIVLFVLAFGLLLLAPVLNAERDWHMSESVPLPPVEPGIPDGGRSHEWDAVAATLEARCPGPCLGTAREATNQDARPTPEQLNAVAPLLAGLDAVPEPSELGGLRFPTPPIDGSDGGPLRLRGLPARGWILRAWSRVETDPAGAVTDLRRALATGTALEHSGGDLVPVAVGVMLQDTVLRHAALMVRQGLLGRDARPLVDDARADAELGSGFPAALRSECVSFEEMFQRMGALGAGDLFERTGPGGGSELPDETGRGVWPFYSTARTLGAHRHRCRQSIGFAAAPPDQRTPLAFESLWEGKPLQMMDNPVGRILLEISSPSWVGLVERRDRIEATRAELAAAVAAAPAPDQPAPSE